MDRLLFFILAVLAVQTNEALAEVHYIDCPAGRVEGTRLDDSDGIQISADGVTQGKLNYLIDTETPENTKVTYSLLTRPASIAHIREGAITIIYLFRELPYMDTIFPNGLVYSTEHKIFFANVVTTWHYQCKFLK